MKIAILGWGSLIWDPRDLYHDDTWQRGGPILPLEFSRISSDGRLTLVIDQNYGESVTTYYTTSLHSDLNGAIENLKKRENLPSNKNIGVIDLNADTSHTRQDAVLVERIRSWARINEYDAVIWTDLPPKFEIDGEAVPFSVDAAVAYLQGLSGETAKKAREYIQKAPREVETPLRRKLRENGWLNEGRLCQIVVLLKRVFRLKK